VRVRHEYDREFQVICDKEDDEWTMADACQCGNISVPVGRR
jgi:hypothetical protein